MKRLLQSILVLSLAVGGCSPETEAPEPQAPAVSQKDDAASAERNVALLALRNAEVLDVAEDGSPTFVRGDLGKLGDVRAAGLMTAQARGRDAAESVAPAFGGRVEDLEFVRSNVDDVGHTHLRYAQRLNGLPVVGGELRLHADAKGNLFLANGRLFRTVPAETARVSAEAALAAARADGRDSLRVDDARALRLVYTPAGGARLRMAWETEVRGVAADNTPVRDRVYVDARSGQVLQRLPQIHTALNRAVYSANNGTSLPGTLKRSEGGAASGDTTVDQNYADLGLTYNCYKTLFNRDGLDGAGSRMVSTVHYSSSYNNAYWDSTQMVYGDGDGSTFGPLGRDQDVTVHELTHGVTENESGLNYSNESGALNEAMSDIASAFCDSWNRSWAVDTAVWQLAERSWTPGTSGDAMRYMANPTQDGSSKDYYPERYTGTSDSGGVHTNSGIANLAFKLLVTGGTHPRSKTSVNVAGVGMEKAARIFYYANANVMSSTTNFSGARTATVQAASALGYDTATQNAVANAWAAVGVGSPVDGGGGDPGGSCTPTALSNGVAVAVSAATGSSKCYSLVVPSGQSSVSFVTSGGTGDLDLYVKAGSVPTTTNYTCKSEGSTNVETCTLNAPAAGTYYVLLNAYTTYSGATLKGTYSGSTSGPQLGASNISGATGSARTWTLSVPAGASALTFKTSGGTGDPDMYVKLGSAPTSTIDPGLQCKSEGPSTVETCTINAPAAGTWYVTLYGWSAYSGVTLTGQY